MTTRQYPVRWKISSPIWPIGKNATENEAQVARSAAPVVGSRAAVQRLRIPVTLANGTWVGNTRMVGNATVDFEYGF